jgi:hypothetical protein
MAGAYFRSTPAARRPAFTPIRNGVIPPGVPGLNSRFSQLFTGTFDSKQTALSMEFGWRRPPTSHVSGRASPCRPAKPDSPPRCAWPRISATPDRSRRAPGQRWPRCRSGIRPARCPGRSRRSTPTDPRRSECRCASRTGRHGRRQSGRASNRLGRGHGGG